MGRCVRRPKSEVQRQAVRKEGQLPNHDPADVVILVPWQCSRMRHVNFSHHACSSFLAAHCRPLSAVPTIDRNTQLRCACIIEEGEKEER